MFFATLDSRLFRFAIMAVIAIAYTMLIQEKAEACNKSRARASIAMAIAMPPEKAMTWTVKESAFAKSKASGKGLVVCYGCNKDQASSFDASCYDVLETDSPEFASDGGQAGSVILYNLKNGQLVHEYTFRRIPNFQPVQSIPVLTGSTLDYEPIYSGQSCPSGNCPTATVNYGRIKRIR
ncbi:MAG: hypothetical protein HC888_00795 [Candidatus Competibacteraceae bacterium]|nr:hypothetical protein [Candidatus Competibacteraceae bacterium]